MNSIHTSSARSDWETPPDLIADLKTVFAFDLDVCASRSNICDTFYSIEDNGLSKPWAGLAWLNPPCGRHNHIDKWLKKAVQESRDGNTVIIALIPARTSTRWWHSTVPFASLCVFIKGRLRFHLPGGKPGLHSAGFPSALVAWGELNPVQIAKLKSYGWSVKNVSA